MVLPKHLRPRMAQPVVPATPMIGNFNKKATNTLLVKTELGKVRQTTFNLPGPQHTYGKALFREDEGTGEMIMSWMEHVPNPHARPGRDFKALNKNAVVSGMVTAKQQTDFRKTHDARLKIGTHEDRRFTLADDFIHGKSTRCAACARVLRSAAPRITATWHAWTRGRPPPCMRGLHGCARSSPSPIPSPCDRAPRTPRRPSTPMVDLISSAYRWSWVAEHLEQEQAAAASPAPKTAVGRPRARSTPKQRSPQALRGAQLMQQAAEPFDPTLSSPAESATVGKKVRAVLLACHRRVAHARGTLSPRALHPRPLPRSLS